MKLTHTQPHIHSSLHTHKLTYTQAYTHSTSHTLKSHTLNLTCMKLKHTEAHIHSSLHTPKLTYTQAHKRTFVQMFPEVWTTTRGHRCSINHMHMYYSRTHLVLTRCCLKPELQQEAIDAVLRLAVPGMLLHLHAFACNYACGPVCIHTYIHTYIHIYMW